MIEAILFFWAAAMTAIVVKQNYQAIIAWGKKLVIGSPVKPVSKKKIK